MRKILIGLLFVLAAAVPHAQITGNGPPTLVCSAANANQTYADQSSAINWRCANVQSSYRWFTSNPFNAILVATAPSGACSAGAIWQLVASTQVYWGCQSGTWTAEGGSGGGGNSNSILVTDPPYNAKCDGTTDDTAAIQAAWNAGYAQNLSVNLPVSTPATPVVCVHHSALVVPATGAWGLKFHGNNATLKYTGAGTEISAPASNDVLIADHLNFDLTTATSSPIVFTIAGGGYSYVECDYCSDYLTGTPTASWKGASLTGAGAELNFVNSEWLSDVSVGQGQFIDSGSEFYGVVVTSTGGWVNLTQTQFYPENGHTGPNDGTCFVCLNTGTGYTNTARFSSIFFHQIADGIDGVSVAAGAGSVSGSMAGNITSVGVLYSAALGTPQNLTACSVIGANPIACSTYTSSQLASRFQTCNAAIVPTGAKALCQFTFSSAQLLAFDSTIATAIPVITAPGANRIIVPDFSGGVAEYVAGLIPYTCLTCSPSAGDFRPAFGANDLQAYVFFQPDLTQSTNQIGLSGWGSSATNNYPAATTVNTSLSFFFNGATLTLGDGTVVLNLPYTVIAAQ